MHQKIFSFFITIFLISCGGGGGGSSEPPLASINLSLSGNSQQEVGSNVTLSWSTSLAISCSASGDWVGSKDPQGTFSLALSSPKNYSFTLSCTNSAGKSSSKSVSVLANYSVVSGSIFNEINSGLEVFIDENHNRVMDVGEPSAISDSSGNFDIRIPNLNQSNMCLRDRPIFINDSHLMSLNPEQNTNINISSATSLFSDHVNLVDTEIDNLVFCDPGDNYLRKRQLISFANSIKRIENYDNYTYEEIEGKSSTKNISDQRLLDINTFYNSINTIEDSIVNLYKKVIDDDPDLPEGITSDSWTWKSDTDLDLANFRIFLNDTSTYPNPTTNQTPQASYISEITTMFDFAMKLVPSDAVPEANLNGWQDKYYFAFYGMHASNNNEIINSTENCYISFTSVCKLDITLSNIIEKSNPFLSFVMSKETSRGLEYIQKEQFKYSYDNCEVYLSYEVVEPELIDTNTSSITRYYLFNDNYDAYYSYEDDECYGGYPNNRYALVAKNFQDGSRISISVRSTSIDNLQLIEDPFYYLEDNLPPSQIPSQYIDIFTQIPLIPKDNEIQQNLMIDTIFRMLSASTVDKSFNVVGRSSNGFIAAFRLNEMNVTCSIYDPNASLIITYDGFEQAIGLCSQIGMVDLEDPYTVLNRSPYNSIQTSSSDPMLEKEPLSIHHRKRNLEFHIFKKDK
jgi:hypothetical protein